jgi:hypothetical protein
MLMPDTQLHERRAVVAEGHFDSIESAHEYVSLLATHVEGVKAALAVDVAEATTAKAGRRLDALRLVDYKLTQLQHHLSAGGRTLNDLRALRRLLLSEREISRLDFASQGD